MCTDVVGVSMTDEHALMTANPLMRIQPQAELRQMNPGAGELNVQQHAESVGVARKLSNLTCRAPASFNSLFPPHSV